MIKSKGKNNYSLNSQTLLIIVIQTECYVLNSIGINNSSILYIVEVGIVHLLHGISESESLFKMSMDPLSEEMELLTVVWIC